MTMFTLPNFCRVCLKTDRDVVNLENLANEPSETLMSKLQHCVSEVEWSIFKPLLCHPCIKRLNVAYTFKKQCVQSATCIKNYVNLVNSQEYLKKTNESQTVPEIIAQPIQQSSQEQQQYAYVTLPNQKIIKILIGSQNPSNPNTLSNVYLNVVPTTNTNPVVSIENNQQNCKDSNENVFVNISNTFQKFITPTTTISNETKIKNVNVDELLTNTKSEELSVEIDPTDYNLDDDCDNSNDGDLQNDWEELLSSSQILINDTLNKYSGNTTILKNQHIELTKYGQFVPILPKTEFTNDESNYLNEKLTSYFFNSGEHFLTNISTPEHTRTDLICEYCKNDFVSLRLLKNHIREFHMGKYPFKCQYCNNEFVLRTDYLTCLTSHKIDSDALNNLTLKDFRNNTTTTTAINGNINNNNSNHETTGSSTEQESIQNDGEIVNCDLCNRQFNSQSGLLRHKVRKHKEKNKKKYFIKGMKNAKCDICNREFSTQSYMQLHRKLHLRDDLGYKYKVFSKNRYVYDTNINNNISNSNNNTNKREISSESDDDKFIDNQNNDCKNESDSEGGNLVIVEHNIKTEIGNYKKN